MEPIDAQESAAFLRQQAATLADALHRPEDPFALRHASAAHEACHDRWVALIASARGRSPAVADAVADLYTLHGRLLESLEHGLEGWFHPQAAADVREVLADRLAQRTRAVVALIAAPGGGVLHLPAERGARV